MPPAAGKCGRDRLTDKGRDLRVPGLFEWGARHISIGGRAPAALSHADCGAPVEAGDQHDTVAP